MGSFYLSDGITVCLFSCRPTLPAPLFFYNYIFVLKLVNSHDFTRLTEHGRTVRRLLSTERRRRWQSVGLKHGTDSSFLDRASETEAVSLEPLEMSDQEEDRNAEDGENSEQENEGDDEADDDERPKTGASQRPETAKSVRGAPQ